MWHGRCTHPLNSSYPLTRLYLVPAFFLSPSWARWGRWGTKRIWQGRHWRRRWTGLDRVSPLRRLTNRLLQTCMLCNPQGLLYTFSYLCQSTVSTPPRSAVWRPLDFSLLCAFFLFSFLPSRSRPLPVHSFCHIDASRAPGRSLAPRPLPARGSAYTYPSTSAHVSTTVKSLGAGRESTTASRFSQPANSRWT